MDAGVMALTGLALRSGHDSSKARVPCIGITPWRKITHREKLYAPSEPGSWQGANGTEASAAASSSASVDESRNLSMEVADPDDRTPTRTRERARPPRA